MKLEQYRAFSQTLQINLEADARVLGLVFLGSAAEIGRIPDDYSDHDFFVITQPNVQETFRQNLSWLPDAEAIILNYRETAHGLKVVFANGHLIEFAIFDEEELLLARLNDYRVIFDKANINSIMQGLHAKSTPDFSPEQAWNGFLSELLIGVRRCQRGEVLSGERFIKQFSLYHLLRLLVHYLPAENKGHLDNLDPYRRLEMIFPELAQEIHGVLLQRGTIAAQDLLKIAERELSARMPAYSQPNLDLFKKFTT